MPCIPIELCCMVSEPVLNCTIVVLSFFADGAGPGSVMGDQELIKRVFMKEVLRMYKVLAVLNHYCMDAKRDRK